MRKYRITKYNPSFRNEKGNYTLNEWTSFGDIGKNFYNGVLTEKDYYEMENKYLQAIKYILNDHKISFMRIIQIEKYDIDNSDISLSTLEKEFIDNLERGLSIDCLDIVILCRLVLRELLWAKLQTADKKKSIEFGYDYYMYFKCDKISDYTKKKIIDIGLFVEEMRES